MKREIKDYLHLYIGCEVKLSNWFLDNTAQKILTGCETCGVSPEARLTFYSPTYKECEDNTPASKSETYSLPMKDVKPILRPIHDMTEQEACEFVMAHPFYGKHQTMHWEHYRRAVHFKVIYNGQSRKWCKQIPERGETPEQFKYLLSKGFDLFGLIDICALCLV